MRKRIAFTLAEVLFALTVVGIICSLTVPALIQNMQEIQYKTAFKQSYSDFSQIILKMANNNGSSIAGICTSSDFTCAMNLIKPYINYTKLCPAQTNADPCWHATGTFHLLNLSDAGIDALAGDGYGFILNNGMLVRINGVNHPCSTGGDACITIDLDVNGFKGPNIWGKDIFAIYFMPNSAITNNGNDCDPKNDYVGAFGYSCGIKILLNRDY